jgi:hypothetical protein
MKHCLLLCCVATLASSAAFAQSAPSSSAHAEILKLEQTIWDHWKAQRFDAMRDMQAVDAVMVHPAGGILSRDAGLALENNEKCAVKSVSLTNVTVVSPTADSAVISYQPKVSGACNGKTLDDERSAHSSVWAKRNGKWLTVLHQMTLLEGTAAMLQTDPILGTWQVNLAKSKYGEEPRPKSHTRTYVLAGDQIKATSKTVGADGKVVNGAWSFSANYDGKETSMSGFDEGDSLTIKRVDSNTFAVTQKKAGKIVSTGTRVMSSDGKTMTITYHYNADSPKGKAYTIVEVFDKR